MSRKQDTTGSQGPKPVEHEDAYGARGSDPHSDQGGGRPGRGQSGGGRASKSPKAIIAGRDGPQTGGNERGNPGVGG